MRVSYILVGIVCGLNTAVATDDGGRFDLSSDAATSDSTPEVTAGHEELALSHHGLSTKHAHCSDRLMDSSSDETSVGCFTPSNSVSALIGVYKNRALYFASAMRGRVTIKEVASILKRHKHNRIPSFSPRRRGFITDALQWAAILLLTLIIILRHPHNAGLQIANIGLDDGQGLKVRRESVPFGSPVEMVSWNMADDEAHAMGNVRNKRPIVSDELRKQMVEQGHSNITFLRHAGADGDTPVLAYHTDDDLVHFHWRPWPGHLGARAPARDKTFSKHYPIFDAGGAGFKISSVNAVANLPSMNEEEAKPIAHAIAVDFLGKRSESTYVGYQERVKGSSMMGHKLCMIAEKSTFALHNEIHKCFPGE